MEQVVARGGGLHVTFAGSVVVPDALLPDSVLSASSADTSKVSTPEYSIIATLEDVPDPDVQLQATLVSDPDANL